MNSQKYSISQEFEIIDSVIIMTDDIETDTEKNQNNETAISTHIIDSGKEQTQQSTISDNIVKNETIISKNNKIDDPADSMLLIQVTSIQQKFQKIINKLIEHKYKLVLGISITLLYVMIKNKKHNIDMNYMCDYYIKKYDNINI